MVLQDQYTIKLKKIKNMSRSLNALIIGAGAIGRGYIPWELKNFNISFFDSNLSFIESMRSQGFYTSFMSEDNKLEKLEVHFELITNNVSELLEKDFDIAFCCVGPRNIFKLPIELGNIQCPLYSLENDPECVLDLRKILDKQDIYFGVPDVITSLTASADNLKLDKLSLHTENGVLYLEDHGDIPDIIKEMSPSINWINLDQMKREWDAKLFLHNTPHCIAAFFGYFHNCTYLHEALSIKEVAILLEGVVGEILQTLKVLTNHDHGFMEDYAAKEIRRFANPLLFDPVTRVAREPLRKLQPNGRLIGALRMAIQAGIVPTNLTIGVAAALKYDDMNDPDHQKINLLRPMGVENFIDYFLDIGLDTAESRLISEAYNNL